MFCDQCVVFKESNVANLPLARAVGPGVTGDVAKEEVGDVGILEVPDEVGVVSNAASLASLFLRIYEKESPVRTKK